MSTSVIPGSDYGDTMSVHKKTCQITLEKDDPPNYEVVLIMTLTLSYLVQAPAKLRACSI